MASSQGSGWVGLTEYMCFSSTDGVGWVVAASEVASRPIVSSSMESPLRRSMLSSMPPANAGVATVPGSACPLSRLVFMLWSWAFRFSLRELKYRNVGAILETIHHEVQNGRAMRCSNGRKRMGQRKTPTPFRMGFNISRQTGSRKCHAAFPMRAKAQHRP